MDKRTYFFRAMAAQEYRRKAWVISAFALTHPTADDHITSPNQKTTAYQLFNTVTGLYYVDPDQGNALVKIDDAVPNEPLFKARELIQVKAGEIPNLSEDIDTTYGRLLFNYIALVFPFGNKVSYINKQVKPAYIEDLITPRLLDTPEDPSKRTETDIYIDEYLKFVDAILHMDGFATLFVPGVSKKAITIAPGTRELRDKLLEEFKDKLHDPATIAAIDAELVKHDQQYLKGDSSEGFLIFKEAVSKVRKRLFGMVGGEAALGKPNQVDLIKRSFEEGWDVKNFHTINNNSRAGSYRRGAETVKGGEAFKQLQRASSNINITIDDCGTTNGMPMTINQSNYKQLARSSIVTENGPLLIETDDVAKTYIGQTVTIRSPMFCKVDKTDFCHVCAGKNLSDTPQAASSAIVDYGSVLLYISMKAMHGKTLEVARMNLMTAIR